MKLSAANILILWRRHVRYVLIPMLGGLAVIAGLGVLSLRWFRHRELAGIMRHEVELVANGFDRFFSPIVSGFDLLTELGQRGFLSLEDKERLDGILNSLLVSQMRYVTQVAIAGSDGRLYYYTKPGQIGDFNAAESRADLEQLAWYKGALDSKLAEQVHWTEPYMFGRLGVPGITGSRWYRVEGMDPPTFVVALKISLDELAKMVQEIGIDHRSKVLMISDAGIRDFDDLLDVNGGAAPLDSFLVEQAASVRAENGPFRKRMKSAVWWFGARRSTAAKSDMRIALVVPERFLREQAGVTFYVLIGGYVLILGTVITAAVLLARRSGQTLASLAALRGHCGDSEEQIKALIHSGEDEAAEFKSTLRWNLKANKADKNIELACLKTMVAFLNTEGGTLLVGVTDEGAIPGIQVDNFPNEDKFLLHFNNLIKEHIGLEFSDLISFSLKCVDGNSILVVDCGRSSDPVFLRHGSEEEFYIRVGPGSRKLPTSKVLDYVRTR